MCFNGYMSGSFAALGFIFAGWLRFKTSNKRLSNAVLFFFLMEFLQFIQYFFLAKSPEDPYCKTLINQVLTVLGFLHICIQPTVTMEVNHALTQKPSPKYSAERNEMLKKHDIQYSIMKRLCMIAGFLFFIRYPMSFIPGWNTLPKNELSTEWLRGHTLCTFKSDTMIHLGWSVPFSDPTYNMMSVGVHSFMMFAPFVAMYDKKHMVVQGFVLWLTGPAMASLFTDNLFEQASIWCFFSIAQIAILLTAIRGKLLKDWAKDKKEKTN